MTARNLFSSGPELITFSAEEARQFCSAGVNVRYEPGEIILNIGAQGESMYILMEGSTEIILPEQRVVVSEPGSYFGELSFLNPAHPRSATIRARTPCRLVRLDQDSVQRLFEEAPGLLFTLMRRTFSVLVSKEAALVSLLRQKNQELEATLDYLRRTREELSQQELLARTDTLTGLYNRRCFDAQLDRYITRSRETGEGIALLYIDLDRFKPINDQLGHAAGDEVLRGVGSILRGQIRRTDLPVRIGGDEFAVILLDVTQQQAWRRAEQIRRAILQMDHPGADQGLRVSASMGGTLYRTPEGAAELLERADRALYAAKDAGRNALSWA